MSHRFIFIYLFSLLLFCNSLQSFAQQENRKERNATYTTINSLYNCITGSEIDTQFAKKIYIVKSPVKMDDAVVWSLGMADSILHYLSVQEFDTIRAHFSLSEKKWNQFRIKHSRIISNSQREKEKSDGATINEKITRKLSRINNQRHPGKYSYEERRLRAKYYRTYFYFTPVAFNSTREYGLFYYLTDNLSACIFLCHFSENQFDKIIVRIRHTEDFP